MKKAKSLYLGGEIITADGLSYSSYKELGLLCCYCEEPVFPKIGYERTNHFSHFKSIDPDKLKKCQLRQENGNLSYDFNEENQAEGNNQRIEIFNRHFLEIVLGSHSELPSLSLSSSQEWKERLLFKECKVDLKDRKKSILKFYKLVPTSQSKLHRKIASEAINYLCSDSGDRANAYSGS